MDGAAGASKIRVITVNRNTYAAKWNSKVLHHIKDALLKDPEVDLTTIVSPVYSKSLQSIKSRCA